jgi:hypothetical protein
LLRRDTGDGARVPAPAADAYGAPLGPAVERAGAELAIAACGVSSVSAAGVGRVVALGASNLTRGLHPLVCSARSAWGPGVEVVAALGHGRSYGVRSRLGMRTRPGILESGLWRGLESLPPTAMRALVTDVGNDILYGFPAQQVVAWVAEAVRRLQQFTADVVLTDLPLASLRRLSTAKFLLFRSILVPSCRLSLPEALEAAERVDAGLAELAAARGVRLLRLRPEWYGFDPIHIRPARWRAAWQQILGGASHGSVAAGATLEGLRLYSMPPERQWLFGVERWKPQSGVALRSGARLWLY